MALVPVSYPYLKEIDVSGILESGVFTNGGKYLREFEGAVAQEIGVDHFVAMANGTLPLEFAVSVLSDPLDEVVVPAFTFAAVASSVVRMGRKIRFADIREDNWTIDWDSCGKFNLAIAPNVFGVLPDQSQEGAIVLDNAEGFGSVSGVFGVLDTYSFHATKIVYCGEGGGIATNDVIVAEKARRWRNFGFDDAGDVPFAGTNAKMSEFHALVGAQSLKMAYWQRKCREEIIRQYRSFLSGKVVFQSGDPYNCVVLIPNRDKVVSALLDHGIDSRRYFFPLHKMKAYKEFSERPLPVSERIGSMALALPTWAGMSESLVDKICSVVAGAI